MALSVKFSVKAPPPKAFGKKARRVQNEFFREVKADYQDLYRGHNNINTAPGTGRLIKSRRVHRNTKPHGKRAGKALLLNTQLTGSSEVVGFIFLHEHGTVGKGGRYPSVRPRRSAVLTIPNRGAGVGSKATARMFPNAVWVPTRDPRRPILAVLAPPKRTVGPNHRQPQRFMTPSRKIERVVMYGVPKLDQRPKGFIRDNSLKSFAGVKKTAPRIAARIFQEALK